jgi:hypothetical protein
MARRTADELAGTPLSLVYIADNTVDAHKAERVLTGQGIDYTLSLEPFACTSVLLVGERTGLFVYVPAAQHRSCRELLEQNGLTDTVEPDESVMHGDR